VKTNNKIVKKLLGYLGLKHPQTIRMVTHLDFTEDQLNHFLAVITDL